MSRKRGYEILLLITYIGLSAVCVYLQFFSQNQAGSLTNLIVNVTMFIIVAAILAACVFGSLLPVSAMTADLIRVTEKIENDAMHSHEFLFDKYQKDKDELFEDKRLVKQYRDYNYELERMSYCDEEYYKCDIADYIGYDLIDSAIHRERLNQVAGVMTGLGILGTFVGLSLGLQSFNTGTTAEITRSIEPLMAGIKVAFHTSIYGMVFSLVFNYVYKKRLDDAEGAVRMFITSYKKYVMPDTTNEGVNRLMQMQKQQTEAILSLADTVANELGQQLRLILQPEFDHFDATLDRFAKMTTRNQMDQLNRIVDVFITELNTSLGSSFTNLSKVVNQSLALQENNEQNLKEIYDKNVATVESVNKVAEQMKEVAEALGRYAKEVHSLETQVQAQAESIRKQSESSKKILEGTRQYMDALEHSVKKNN